MNPHYLIQSPLDLSIKSGCRVIGIMGKAGVGKDTVAEFLTSTYKNVYHLSFADKLKDICALAFNLSKDCFTEQSLKALPDPFWGVTPRAMAQHAGTELFRQLVHPDFWIAHVVQEVNKCLEVEMDPNDPDNPNTLLEYIYDKTDTVVISDCRFQNEYDWIISQKGMVIHLVRPGVEAPAGGISGHASEAISSIQLHCPERTFTIANDSTIPNLYHKVGKLFIDFLTPSN